MLYVYICVNYVYITCGYILYTLHITNYIYKIYIKHVYVLYMSNYIYINICMFLICQMIRFTKDLELWLKPAFLISNSYNFDIIFRLLH